ncbi:MAG: hypothetical protein QOI85_2271 [Chloroflexota bacterium]|jgi:hypothetical protein|nr:hypothetical protein [Chloroflexota bacterium]
MKYMMLIADAEDGMARSTEEEQATYGRIGAWWNEHTAAGRIIEGHELEPSSTATTVRIGSDGETTVTDGPFAEGKEMVGGYGILDVPDLDAALALASSWPGTATTLEIRPIVERDATS